MSTNMDHIGREEDIDDIYVDAGQQSSASANHRIEALRTLSTSILRELDSLQREKSMPNEQRIDLNKEVRRYEADLIRLALLRSGGRQRAAARLLNVNPTTLHEKIKRLGMHTLG